MSDETLRELAGKAGIATTWTDQRHQENHVSPETLRAILTALGLSCGNDDDLRNSLSVVEMGAPGLPGDFTTARVGQPVVIPVAAEEGSLVEIAFENGAVRSVTTIASVNGLLTLPPFEEPGYHRARFGAAEIVVATAPERCVTIPDLTGGRGAWGLIAQVWSLRRAGDGGIGDLGGVVELVKAAAARGADALAISPLHALFGAEPRHFSPYSPSTRLFHNPLHADPAAALPADLIARAVGEAGLGEAMARLEALPLVDWPEASRVRRTLLRQLFDLMRSERDLPALRDYERFVGDASPLLRDHVAFEIVHGREYGGDGSRWDWRSWGDDLRRPDAPGVAEALAAEPDTVGFEYFLQWLAARSLTEAQRHARESGMKVGLIADLAIGMDGGGSHAWSRQSDILTGLSVGAPPDYYSSDGQSWGLTTFSPRGLAATGFAPFIETLRAVLRHVGGLRMDHAMGMSRLWLVPHGAPATQGAYLSFPSEALFRLTALESWRHKAVVIGEDLGTLPDGFRDYLREQGVYGMRVLRFEKNERSFHPVAHWSPDAVAMTSTHDAIATAGWWSGADLDPDAGEGEGSAQSVRAWDRGLLWSAFEREGLVHGERPAPGDTAAVVDAAIGFVGRAPCHLKLVPLEDLLGLEVQPNVPGTTSEKPNWRHRLAPPAGELLDEAAVSARVERLDRAVKGGA